MNGLKKIAIRTSAVAAATLLVLPLASAQDYDVDRNDDAPWVRSDVGIAPQVGGGVAGFTDGTANDATGIAGTWTARLTVGTRTPLALEAAYNGTAQDVAAVGLDTDAVLISNGVEGALRLNFTQTAFQPFAFAGLGWRHYTIANDDFNFSSVQDNDDVGEVPVGVGFAYRWQGLILDGRFALRPTFSDDLFTGLDATDDTSLMTWDASARLGWEF